MAARLAGDTPLVMAQRMYGQDSETAAIITKANEVVAGTTQSGNWAADLVSEEGAAVAAFLEYLRPQTILGKFGTDGIPGLTSLDFYTPYIIETGGGDRSEEHTSELQSLMRNSYAVFCLKQNKHKKPNRIN